MTKKLLLLFALCFCSLHTNAQGTLGPITITHGVEIEQDSEKIVEIAGESNGKIYTLATKGKGYFVKIFNSSDMSLVLTNKIELPDLGKKEPDFEKIEVIDGKVYLFGSTYDRKEKKANLVGLEISEEGVLSGNNTILFETTVTKKSEKGQFYFKKSPNKNQLLVLHAALFEKEDAVQYEVKLFDATLGEITSSIEKVAFKDRKDLEFSITDLDVNNAGDIILDVNESYRDKKAKQNIEKFELHLFKKANSYAKEIVKINFTDSEVINCEILANNKGKVQLVGFYSDVRKNGKPNKDLKGVYAVTVDVASNAVEQLKFNPFDLATKIKLLGKRRAENGKDVKPLYVSHSLIEKQDGGLILLSEYQLVTVGNPSKLGVVALTPIMHVNNEIIVTSLNPDGSVAWSNVIAKKQKAAFTVVSLGFYAFAGNSNFTVSGGISVPIGVLGKGPEYLSAMPIYENEKLTVVFNDNVKNIGVTDIEEVKNLGSYNKAVPTAFVFDKEGKITRIDQEDATEDQLVLRPRVYYRTSPSEYIIYSSRKSEDKLGRMSVGKPSGQSGQ